MSRRIKNGSEDRMSNFPDAILHHILSFVPIKDTVKTCLLSKRWKELWCSLPSLNLGNSSSFPNHHVFEKFVTFLISTYDDYHIQKLRLVHDTNNDASLISAWIIWAIKHKLQVLDLKILLDVRFHLPCRLFTCTSLAELNLELNPNHDINLPSPICMPGLRILRLFRLNFKGDQRTEALLSSFPLLQTLGIGWCKFGQLKSLNISFDHLKNLSIEGFSDPMKIIIRAPNLIDLRLHIALTSGIWFQSNFSSLAHADLDIASDSNRLMGIISTIFRHTVSLTLSYRYIKSCAKVLPKERDILEAIKIPFHNRKRLELGTSFTDGEILMIKTLLKYSPNVETVFLANQSPKVLPSNETTTETDFEGMELGFEYTLPRLKLAEIRGFQGSGNEVKFVQFVLENATALQELVVTVSTSSDNLQEKERMIEIGRKLRRYPRASSSVGLIYVVL